MDKEKLREIILNLGADVCGFAGEEHMADGPEGFRPVDIYPKAKTAVVFGISLVKATYDISPRLVYNHHNNLSKNFVDRLTYQTARYIEDAFAGSGLPLPADGPYDAWDEKTLTGHGILSMKHIAVAAGIGALGKNTVLLNPQFGNRLTVGAVLTDLTFSSDEPAENICLPNCQICIDSCPVGAIQGDGTVTQYLCRPNAYEKNERGFEINKCNTCRTVCPMRFGK